MALIKQFDLKNGTSGNYWKIIRPDIDFLEKRAEIWLGLFRDKKFNDDYFDKAPINSELVMSTKRVIFTPDNFPFSKNALEGVNIKAVAYAAIKQTDEFFFDADDDF